MSKNSKIAIISDIHGNLDALLAVEHDMKMQRVDKIIDLGDTIGYGPFQKECVEIVKEIATIVLKGNHEFYFLNFETASREISEYVMAGIAFSRHKLEEYRAYLESLPYKTTIKELGEEIKIAHASPSGLGIGKRINEISVAAEELGKISERICFVGHTHQPMVYDYKKGWRDGENLPNGILLEKGEKYLINVGSVGQPRGSRSYVGYAVYGILEYKDGKYFFNWRKVSYDIRKTQQAIRKFGLPEFSATRLSTGE